MYPMNKALAEAAAAEKANQMNNLAGHSSKKGLSKHSTKKSIEVMSQPI